jgi:hypothetical protein
MHPQTSRRLRFPGSLVLTFTLLAACGGGGGGGGGPVDDLEVGLTKLGVNTTRTPRASAHNSRRRSLRISRISRRSCSVPNGI